MGAKLATVQSGND